jgi:tubulin polyglutamylase TTLL5
VIPWHPSAFELFGYDVLVDADLKPWLIEVNSSPSLARDHPLDCEIKNALLRDILNVVDPPAVDRGALRDVLQVG